MRPPSAPTLTTEKLQLLALIEDYKKAVEQAAGLINAKSEKQRGFHWTSHGYLDDANQIRYMFHGVGCLVIIDGSEVDFDLGEGARCDGIDYWFLYHFLDTTQALKQKYDLLTDDSQIKNLLQQLEADGAVARPADPSYERLYYLTADLHQPNPPTVKLHWPEGMEPDEHQV